MAVAARKISKPVSDKKIPKYLKPFIAKQKYNLYSAIDHASWRYMMRVSRAFFSKFAHKKYVDGLAETGISTERVPRIQEMDACLKRFGWRAVAVVGFIPPGAFMEFLSLRILPIACDIRRLEHLAYTPAPDIFHEAAGHAPIIADPEYAAYLQLYGEIAPKVIFSDKDLAVYEAIRALSDIKEDVRSTSHEIAAAQVRLDQALAHCTYVSEATELSRMGWWSFEYGLVGDISNPKIYGAGLLSSVGESYKCLNPEVKKLPMTLDCIKMSYDITRPQPQLFVAKDFKALSQVLKDYIATTAYAKGGAEGLRKALEAKTVTTCGLDSGLQISGVLHEVSYDLSGKPAFLKFEGPVQLADEGLEMPGHSTKYHKMGFSSPIGILKGLQKTAADLSLKQLHSLGLGRKLKTRFEFESGIVIEGFLKKRLEKDGKNLVLTFDQCTMHWGDKVLFQPDWGTFDLACGNEVVSVFGGPADRAKYYRAVGGFKQQQGIQKSNLTASNSEVEPLYKKLRQIRERLWGQEVIKPGKAHPRLLKKIKMSADMKHKIAKDLGTLVELLNTKFQSEWLLHLELLEMNAALGLKAPWENQVRSRLNALGNTEAQLGEMVQRGLRLISSS